MDWRLKSLIRHSLLALPSGDRFYRWLTVSLLGTNAGMAYKWFRVMPAHVRVLQEFFPDDPRGQRLWCFDSGATMAAGLAIAVASDMPGLLTDRTDRLRERYCWVSRRVLKEQGEALATLAAAPVQRVADLLLNTDELGVQQALATMAITYAPRHAVALEPVWRGQLGCVFSAGTLEHYTPEALEQEVAGMAHALKPGGVLSHVVDHRDHRWHADKTVHPLAHLTMEEECYQRQFANTLEYHNRWLRGRYVDLYRRYGFRVECRDAVVYPSDLPPFDRATLAPAFADATAEELNGLVTHFIAVKR